MQTLRVLLLASALFLSACATVSTRVVALNPAVQYPPTQYVEVLLERPPRPHNDIAMLEGRGFSEAELLNDAREKAGALGADAIVRTEIRRIDHPPVALYDPWYDPFYWGYSRYRPYPMFPQPWGPYRMVGGASEYVLKAVAIKYQESVPPPAQASPK
jgi:hypothetical protein